MGVRRTSLIRYGILLLAFVLSGCLGIAHVLVEVPPLRVTTTAADSGLGNVKVEMFTAGFYGTSDAFLAMVTGTTTDRSTGYERRLVEIAPLHTAEAVFPSESRYIGFPAMLPGPSERSMKQRTLLFRLDTQGDAVYRLSLLGEVPTVEKTSVAASRGALPEVLRAPRPESPTADWYGILSTYYSGLEWASAPEIAVVSVARTVNEDHVAINVGRRGES